MEKKLNEILVRVSSRASVDQEVDLGEDIELLVHGQVVQKSQNENQNGTFNVVLTVKPYGIQIKGHGTAPDTNQGGE